MNKNIYYYGAIILFVVASITTAYSLSCSYDGYLWICDDGNVYAYDPTITPLPTTTPPIQQNNMIDMVSGDTYTITVNSMVTYTLTATSNNGLEISMP